MNQAGEKIKAGLQEAVDHADLDRYLHETMTEMAARIKARGGECKIVATMWFNGSRIPRRMIVGS